MNPMPQLAPQLKLLRLSGILDSLEVRNRQAIEDNLAYTEFLALLIADEVARREQKKFDLRLRRANFRTEKNPGNLRLLLQPHGQQGAHPRPGHRPFPAGNGLCPHRRPFRHRQEPSGPGTRPPSHSHRL